MAIPSVATALIIFMLLAPGVTLAIILAPASL
jgi:hypothetical protein